MLEQAMQDGGTVTTGRQGSGPACSVSASLIPGGEDSPSEFRPLQIEFRKPYPQVPLTVKFITSLSYEI